MLACIGVSPVVLKGVVAPAGVPMLVVSSTVSSIVGSMVSEPEVFFDLLIVVSPAVALRFPLADVCGAEPVCGDAALAPCALV